MLTAFALILMALAPLQSPAPSAQQAAITEGLDWYCTAWMKRGAADIAPPRHEEGARSGWRENASAKPAVGPILAKGGPWGQASLVRVSQPTGHRCSISMQLSRTDWTTDTAHAAVTAWVAKAWPNNFKSKDRQPGPRGGRETIWNAEGDLTLTLQESPEAGAQPNVFITLSRQDRDGNAI